ncbi:NAD-dependent epimerase/dehydratase family protein [Furfurilactobacillus curtus]|uniref:Epimerase n=1 Tax=Furfurilactobacillus curtus TaxID=1746200 RepID=A0ABQ5JT64_9LACO
MSKVLITGGAGFIGSNLAERLIGEGHQITIVDDLSMGLKENIPDSKQVTFYEHSIIDHGFMEKLLVDNDFEYIFLLAAVASVADSIERPLYTHEVNQEANIYILEAIRTNGLKPKKVLFSSSAAVYGNEQELPKREISKVSPITPYAIDEFATERYLVTYANLYKLNFVTVRFFNVYGPRQNPKSPYSGVISILTEALQKGTEFKIFGDGEQSRDFVYISDVLDALELLTFGSNVKGDVFNIATGHETSLNQIVRTYQKIAQTDINVSMQDARTGDIKVSVASVDKLKELGYMPKISVSEGLTRYWQYINLN